MAVQGIFASHQGIVGDRVGDFASGVLMVMPTGTAPLLALSSGTPKEKVTDTMFHWFEDTHISGRTQITAAAAAGATAIIVADGSYYTPNTILMVEETGEYLLITSTAGNTLTVIRGLAGTTPTAVTAVMNVQQIGRAFEEGSGMPTPVGQQGKPRINYVQIFRNAWAITGTAQQINFNTGSREAKNRRDCLTYHAEDIERALIWGKQAVMTLNQKQFRMTDGLLAQIEGYGGVVESAASGGTPGNYSLGDFQDFIRRCFAKGVKGQPNERITFGGDMVLSLVQRMAQLDSTYNISQGETKYGIMITTIVTPFGQLKLMTHPLMNENPVWQRQLYVLHPGGFKKRVFRETFEDNYDSNGTRINGLDASQGVVTSELGIQVECAQCFGILRNVQAAVATA